MLDKLIDSHVAQQKEKLGLTEDSPQDVEDIKRMKAQVYQMVSNEVLERYGEDLVQEMRQRVDAEEKKLRQAWRRKNLVEMVIDAIILASLIGLTVNQGTNLIEQIRLKFCWSPVTTPIALILFLTIIIFFFTIVKMGLRRGKGDALE